MEVTAQLQLSFISNTHEIIRMNIPRANTALTAQQAEDAMDAIIACGIVLTGKGKPQLIDSAELVKTEVSSLDLTA